MCGAERGRRLDLSMVASRLDSEEVTVSQLLQSLRDETQRADRLQDELLSSAARFENSDFNSPLNMTVTDQTPSLEHKGGRGCWRPLVLRFFL